MTLHNDYPEKDMILHLRERINHSYGKGEHQEALHSTWALDLIQVKIWKLDQPKQA